MPDINAYDGSDQCNYTALSGKLGTMKSTMTHLQIPSTKWVHFHQTVQAPKTEVPTNISMSVKAYSYGKPTPNNIPHEGGG